MTGDGKQWESGENDRTCAVTALRRHAGTVCTQEFQAGTDWRTEDQECGATVGHKGNSGQMQDNRISTLSIIFLQVLLLFLGRVSECCI